jgi:transposase InsO family protein
LVDNLFSRFGPPLVLSSDRGTHFINDLVRQLSQLYGIQQSFSPAYSPWVNGSVERANGSIVSRIRAFALERPLDWDLFLQPVLFAMRSTASPAIGVSPYEMIFGTRATLPTETAV